LDQGKKMTESKLTVEAIKEKIKKVETDIETLRSNGSAGRQLEILSEYKDYLIDEMAMLKRENG